MGIYSKQFLRGCGLLVGVLFLLLILSPALSFRLQNQNSQIQSKSTQNHSQSGNASRSKGTAWPPLPRIPLWGFLPSHSATSEGNNNVASPNENSQVANSKPSKREMPLNGLKLEPALPPDEFPFLEEDEEDDLDWLVNYKRSSSSGQRSQGNGGSGVKRTRVYDVPQIECPPADDGMERFACPTPDKLGRYPCVDDHVLCDGFVDCPGREDEDRQACMFYKTTKAHLDVLADALLRWARGRR